MVEPPLIYTPANERSCPDSLNLPTSPAAFTTFPLAVSVSTPPLGSSASAPRPSAQQTSISTPTPPLGCFSSAPARQPTNTSRDSVRHLLRWMIQRLQSFSGLIFVDEIRRGRLVVWYYRLLGAKLGRDVFLNTVRVRKEGNMRTEKEAATRFRWSWYISRRKNPRLDLKCF